MQLFFTLFSRKNMAVLKLLLLLIGIGFFSCTSSVKNTEDVTKIDTSKSHQQVSDTVTNQNISTSKSIVDTTNNSVTTTITTQIKKINPPKKTSEIGISKDERSEERMPQIIPAIQSNTYTLSNGRILFTNKYKSEIDPRIGCSGGSSEFSFSVESNLDTFYFENSALKELNFKCSEDGGLRWASGENPSKGIVVGKLKPDNTWLINVNVWVPMKDQFDNVTEKHIPLNGVFIR